jgi:hypothetical protein
MTSSAHSRVRPALAAMALCAVLLLAPATGQGGEGRPVQLNAPLTTMVPADHVPALPSRLEAEVVVGADAPADLGVGAFVADGHGRWFRSPQTRRLPPGRHQLSFDLGDHAALVSEPDRAQWSAYARGMATQAGLFLWSQSASRATIRIERLEVAGGSRAASMAIPRLCDLAIDGLDAQAGVARGRTGARWSLSLRPDPFPDQPYDQARFQLQALITGPDGQQWQLAGFYRQPLELIDHGDREQGVPTAGARFEVRFRPGLPGVYKVRLEATWAGQLRPVAMNLPDLVVSGEPWDDFVRVDPVDPRFFSTGSRIDHSRFYWPVGLNLHSVWDMRTRDCCHTKLTPHRLWNAYEAYLRRLAASGGTAAEIWLCSWSLVLEWRGDWTEFHGVGRYSDENAERLDRVLDLAYSLGIRINLVINNHGQASTSCDKEWDNNPWNAANGGPLAQAEKYFTDQLPLDGQDRYRRYIIARWADHPAVLGWKLWSEQNLTVGGGNLRQWHIHAAERWQSLDHYGHGVTTHWAGDYRSCDRAIVQQPGMDYICIDAYHGRETLLAQLVWDGLNAGDGFAQYHKPILVTEFGGSPGAAPQPQLIAEHHSGPWAGLVGGNAGAPMLWWFEWVDQREQWSPYRAVTRFLAGEDLRGPDAKPSVLATGGGQGGIWSRAWTRPGRILGYLMDQDWGQFGETNRVQEGVVVHVGDSVQAGTMVVEWWDAESGERLAVERLEHAVGPLDLAVPKFTHHLAYKLYRDGAAPTAQR